MTLQEIAKNINKVRMSKVKRLARYLRIDVLDGKSRKEIIEEMKNKNMYKKLISEWSQEEEVNDELDRIDEGKFICTSCYKERDEEEYIGNPKCYDCGEEMISKRKFIKMRRGIKNKNENDKGSKQKDGYVYVLVSSEKPNLVKIGMTYRNPEERAKELSSSTGVSMPYIVAYKMETPNPERVEKKVHGRLSQKRVNPDREFFRVETNEAIRVIEEVV
jgi:predicted RNA-binding Zn-ribbon protein involved in translation (DUF1610 family)